MRKVQQIGTQDCLAASLASLLDLPLGVVPVFERCKDGHAQLRLTQSWLARIGLSLVEIKIRKGRPAPWRAMAVPVPCIVIVAANKKWDHAVVGKLDKDGVSVLHDPARDDEKTGKYKIVSVMLIVSSIPRDGNLENLRLLKE